MCWVRSACLYGVPAFIVVIVRLVLNMCPSNIALLTLYFLDNNENENINKETKGRANNVPAASIPRALLVWYCCDRAWDWTPRAQVPNRHYWVRADLVPYNQNINLRFLRTRRIFLHRRNSGEEKCRGIFETNSWNLEAFPPPLWNLPPSIRTLFVQIIPKRKKEKYTVHLPGSSTEIIFLPTWKDFAKRTDRGR